MFHPDSSLRRRRNLGQCRKSCTACCNGLPRTALLPSGRQLREALPENSRTRFHHPGSLFRFHPCTFSRHCRGNKLISFNISYIGEEMQGLSAIGCRLSAVGWAVFPNVGDVRLSDIRHRGFPNARGGRLRRPFIMRPSGRHYHLLNPLNPGCEAAPRRPPIGSISWLLSWLPAGPGRRGGPWRPW